VKNKSYIIVGFVILVFGIYFVPKIVSRIQNGTVVDLDRHAIGKETASSESLVEIGKVPHFEFVNQNNDTISNDNYKDKVYLVEFFFTSCPSICPVMNSNLVKLQNAFRKSKDFGIASFTIDPSHDTPEVLKAYADKYGVRNPNWNMMTGDLKTIYKLANTGFNLYAGVNPNAEGGFEHSGFFALVDKKGYIRSRIDNFGNPIVYYDGTSDSGIKMLEQDVRLLLNQE
jgi:protein SCO1/2